MKKLLILSLLLIAACSGTLRRGGRLTDGPVSYQTILAGSHSLGDTAYVVLVKNEVNWEKTWILAKGKIEPLPNKPTVDFKKQYVIAAFMGERPSSGYRIEISSIEKRGKVLDVHIKRYETPGMLTVMTSPFYLARVPKGNYKINVIEEIVQ